LTKELSEDVCKINLWCSWESLPV